MCWKFYQRHLDSERYKAQCVIHEGFGDFCALMFLCTCKPSFIWALQTYSIVHRRVFIASAATTLVWLYNNLCSLIAT